MIMQDPIQQGTQKNTLVTWDGGDCMTQLEPRSFPMRLSLFPASSQHCWDDVTSETMKRCGNCEVLRPLGTDFYQDGFLELISRNDK
ncbi:hypothetical protein AVEN_105080-1 [Araneus ventricosus]|uniref:Uncharacterized protein n=1 Tax=Araneus ventricosus TaxID=182803 RepID=A0A4Y2GQX0_ARAVE|nr:hypothetical protein AVEN_105080-1 [Araneus ventricosus]